MESVRAKSDLNDIFLAVLHKSGPISFDKHEELYSCFDLLSNIYPEFSRHPVYKDIPLLDDLIFQCVIGGAINIFRNKYCQSEAVLGEAGKRIYNSIAEEDRVVIDKVAIKMKDFFAI